VKINIVDTPGHADFGGEVERVLNMVDGALLLIDAAEGPMPQTRFVLRKALTLGLRVIVVINKIERANARIEEALNETFDLFIELGANDRQAEFPVIYAIGLDGRAGYTPEELQEDLGPLFETIIKEIPAPVVDLDGPARMLVTTLDYDNYKGQIGIGRLVSGTLTRGMRVAQIAETGERKTGTIEYLYTHHNLGRVDVDEVQAGDILAFAGLDEINISDTIADVSVEEGLPPISVEAPTVRMTFGVNTSPFAGREGKTGLSTSRKLRERLYNETRTNVALRVEDTDQADKFTVSGRGELHLAILIETMRREGYEFEVSKPEVIYQRDPDTGELMEPVEEVHVEVADSAVGVVVELLGIRRGQMIDMSAESGTTFLKYLVPTRGLLGFRARFLTATSGLGQIHALFHGYEPMAGSIPGRQFGSLVAFESGTAVGYGLNNAQERGTLFIEPGTEVYQGMVVGEHIRPGDLAVNVAKTKHLTNHRANTVDSGIQLAPVRSMSLDDCIDFLAEDDLLEITPNSMRIRKRILDNERREKDRKNREKMLEAV
jgi:GTP-binding protein